ncbi:unnamed protein product [Discosporangium mesarthrocarpum]
MGVRTLFHLSLLAFGCIARGVVMQGRAVDAQSRPVVNKDLVVTGSVMLVDGDRRVPIPDTCVELRGLTRYSVDERKWSNPTTSSHLVSNTGSADGAVVANFVRWQRTSSPKASFTFITTGSLSQISLSVYLHGGDYPTATKTIQLGEVPASPTSASASGEGLIVADFNLGQAGPLAPPPPWDPVARLHDSSPCSRETLVIDHLPETGTGSMGSGIGVPGGAGAQNSLAEGGSSAWGAGDAILPFSAVLRAGCQGYGQEGAGLWEADPFVCDSFRWILEQEGGESVRGRRVVESERVSDLLLPFQEELSLGWDGLQWVLVFVVTLLYVALERASEDSTLSSTNVYDTTDNMADSIDDSNSSSAGMKWGRHGMTQDVTKGYGGADGCEAGMERMRRASCLDKMRSPLKVIATFTSHHHDPTKTIGGVQFPEDGKSGKGGKVVHLADTNIKGMSANDMIMKNDVQVEVDLDCSRHLFDHVNKEVELIGQGAEEEQEERGIFSGIFHSLTAPSSAMCVEEHDGDGSDADPLLPGTQLNIRSVVWTRPS